MKNHKILDKLFGFLLITAGMGLLFGLYTGLIYLGVSLPDLFDTAGAVHGPLMINGFLATLISLERGAALEKNWSYIAPLSFALATVLLLMGSGVPGGFFLLLGSLILVLIVCYICHIQPVVYNFIMAGGAVALLTGNVLFILNVPIHELIGWWIAFPLLTIFGERLELNRIMRPPKKAQNIFLMIIILWIGSLVIVHFGRFIGWQINAVALIGIAFWLIRYDVARHTIKSEKWTRYSALCLLTGYGWLIVAGIMLLIYGLPAAGFVYDALLHIFFIGFVFSMIFAHAAVILPALTGIIVPWNRYFYLPLFLLHGFLILRVSGDLFYILDFRVWGSYGNVAAILLFIGGIAGQIMLSKRTGSKHE